MKRILKTLFIKIPLLYIVLSVILVIVLKFLPVRTTPLMWKRTFQNSGNTEFSIRKQWVPMREISPAAVKCVIASEDNRFAEHHGFDFDEMKKMKKEHDVKGKKWRGCSTISQQTAKNVFTFGSHSMVRKVFEAYHTFLIEIFWGKERIMEVYLNVIETGNGLFGIESAARQYFNVPASRLDLNQSALIAAILPNPSKWNPSRPTKYLLSRQKQIVGITRMLVYPEWVMK